MHCARGACRSPNAVRFARAPGYARQASFFPAPFFSRFPGGGFAGHNEIAPLFRLFDEVAGQVAPQFRHGNNFTYQPRFDVQEAEDSYELRGEVPGVESSDISVEFTDPQTLIVRGHTEKSATQGTQPAAAAADANAVEAARAKAEADNSDAASTYSTGSYQKPSVEDDVAESSTAAEAKEAEAANEKQVEKTAEEAQPAQPAPHYWISERSTGSFQRVFKFPSRVDQDAVKASLKNGILSIVVPKAAPPVAKKITVE